jgi:CRISPR-associated protein (TIGR03986 family)
MPFIPSPYNFVPLNQRIWWHPDSAHLSQDRPFRDGLSGWIIVEIEAKTEIYVRAAGNHDGSAIRGQLAGISGGFRSVQELIQSLPTEKKYEALSRRLDDWTDFYRLPNTKLALPDTTVKGMLRSVTEIITFSRLWRTDANARYSVRDFGTGDSKLYRDWMTLTTYRGKERVFVPKPHSAWLYLDEQRRWRLQPCNYARLEHRVLTALMQTAVNGGNPGWAFPQCAQARDAYSSWIKEASARGIPEPEALHIDCEFDPQDQTEHLWPVRDNDSAHAPGKLRFRRAMPKGFSKMGTYTLVFTGCATNNKHREFVFERFQGSQDDPVVGEENGEEAGNGVVRDFLFIHSDEEGDWKKFWERKFEKHEPIPVFYLAFSEANPTCKSPPVKYTGKGFLHSIGLASMYKLACRHTFGEALFDEHRERNRRIDVADGLFGFVEGGESLRGRFNCEPFELVSKHHVGDIRWAVLGSPKPSFYPNYIEQKPDPRNPDRLRQLGADRRGRAIWAPYDTLMSEQPTLRGRKRYVVHPSGAAPAISDPNQTNPKSLTFFRPLPAGAKFHGRVHFHNLRPWELGALLWAMTWGEATSTEPRHWHSVGMAKPLGFGAVALKVGPIKAVDCCSNQPNELKVHDLTGAFLETIAEFAGLPREKGLTEQRFAKFRELPEIEELLSMADSKHQVPDNQLAYPNLPDFAHAKRDGLILPPFSKISEIAAG